LDTSPSGIADTVIEMRPSERSGLEVSE